MQETKSNPVESGLASSPSSSAPHNETPEATTQVAEGPESRHLNGGALALVMGGLLLCLFLPALDQLILTTAIPRIVSQFDSLSEISWIPNAYFLTMGSFMAIYGQVLNLAPLKHVVLVSIFLFELGSLLCGVAFNMHFLLFGRGVAGVGAGGLFVCVFASVAQIAPLEKRPKLMGLGGAVFGVTSIIGPLVGGALTDSSTWRWCFFINLPIGGLAAAIITFFLPNYPAPPKPSHRQGWRGIFEVDYVGGILLLGTSLTLLYSLVEGGNVHPWNSPVIIALFVTSGVLMILFVAWATYLGKAAIVPLRLLRNRTVVGASFAGFFSAIGLMVSTVYLTTWFQAVKGHGPTRSGVDILSLSLITSVFAVITGILVGKVGRYWHLLLLAPIPGAVAAGLFFTINEHTPMGRIVGYQILWACSLGSTLQLPTVAVQAEYEHDLVDTRFATSIVAYITFLGRMVGLAMGSALFTNKLATYLKILAPTAPYEAVLHSVTIIWQLPPDIRAGVIRAYVLSLRYAFILGVPAAGLTMLSTLLIRDLRFRKDAINGKNATKELA